jgi:drug/metabolite transporter (DMT)-like permease
LMFEIIKRAGPVFFSTSNYIATLAGVGLGILLFGDRPSLWIWAALVLMFLGLFCVNSTASSEKQEKS